MALFQRAAPLAFAPSRGGSRPPGPDRTAEVSGQARVHGIPEAEVVEKITLTEPAVKRLVEPAEVADLAVFLCGPQMSFANGSSFVLDGGWTAR